MTVHKGNKRRKTTFRKARGYDMKHRFNNCDCRNCKDSPTGLFGVTEQNRVRRLNKAREDVAAH